MFLVVFLWFSGFSMFLVVGFLGFRGFWSGRVPEFLWVFWVFDVFAVFLGFPAGFPTLPGLILESVFLWRCFCRQKPPCKLQPIRSHFGSSSSRAPRPVHGTRLTAMSSSWSDISSMTSWNEPDNGWNDVWTPSQQRLWDQYWPQRLPQWQQRQPQQPQPQQPRHR